jgi:hypothetical protein
LEQEKAQHGGGGKHSCLGRAMQLGEEEYEVREERTSLARLAFSQCPPCLAIRNTFFRASTSTVGLLPGPEGWHLPDWRVNHLTQPLSPDNRLY